MKIIKISLLSILLWSCAQQVNLYPEGVTKELFTISVPDERVPLRLPTIASNENNWSWLKALCYSCPIKLTPYKGDDPNGDVKNTDD